MILKNYLILLIALSALFLSGCLMTRSEVGEADQSRVYSKKTAQNQESQLSGKQAASSEDSNELIRTLNGRVEALENQINILKNEKSQENQLQQQKIQTLQEALVKMESQITKIETEVAQKNATAQLGAQPTHTAAPIVKSSDESDEKIKLKSKTKNKSDNSYEVAQGFYANKDWKKAILNYQKYIDENPKGKEVADSKYKIGTSFQELGMKDEAMAFFEEVMAQFSKTEAAKKAKLRLSKLKK